jgi:hypothetical protein
MADLDDSRICYWKDEDGLWWIYLPKCGAGVLSKHTIQEHDDGTVTVNPSILMTGHDKGTAMQRHGYLERGKWREV